MQRRLTKIQEDRCETRKGHCHGVHGGEWANSQYLVLQRANYMLFNGLRVIGALIRTLPLEGRGQKPHWSELKCNRKCRNGRGTCKQFPSQFSCEYQGREQRRLGEKGSGEDVRDNRVLLWSLSPSFSGIAIGSRTQIRLPVGEYTPLLLQ